MPKPGPTKSIRPRSLKVEFKPKQGPAIPKHWFKGNAVASHLTNGINLLFPAGERFFIRSMRPYLDQIEDGDFKAEVKGFIGQEAQHAKAHEEYFKAMEEQGYDIQKFLKFYEEAAFGMIEKVLSPKLRLAVTVACEHFTAIMAEDLLRKRPFDELHPAIRDLLYWHASEEIEHKSVAFDMLMRIDPRYATRMAGLFVGTFCLGGFWFIGTSSLVWQDRKLLGVKRFAREFVDAYRDNPVATKVFLKGIMQYAKPGFHPSENENSILAEDYLESVGMA